MSDKFKYEEVLDKYGLDDLRKDYVQAFVRLDERPVSVGIFGEGQTVLKVLEDLFDIPELKEILFPGDFRIQLQYGENKEYKQMERGNGKALSFSGFSQKMQGMGGLEEEDHIFEGEIILPDPVLNHLTILGATLSETLEDKVLLSNDICAVALSATHMLSIKERNFIKNPLNIAKCYFLCDIDMIHEEEREHIKSLVDPYLSDGEKCCMIPDNGASDAILDSWITASNIRENRIAAVDIYFKPIIYSAICGKLSSISCESTFVHQIAAHLESAKNEIPTYQEKTIRYVYTNYIDGVKTNTTSEILCFYEKLNDDIAEGIREERNIKELQEELPNYIAGAWTEFVERDLSAQIQVNVDTVAPAIEEYVDEKVELFLKELLTQEELEHISTIISSTVSGSRISENKAESVSGNTPLEKKENTMLRRVLPKCLMALGGVAILSSLVLPGALLMAAGFKGNKDAIEEAQSQLVEAGRKLNYEYLKEVQSNLEELIARIKVGTEVTVEQCYSKMIDTINQMIRLYQEKAKTLDENMASVNADLETI